MSDSETVVLKTRCATVTDTFVQLSAPCPAVLLPIARVTSIHTPGFGRSSAGRRRLWLQGAVALLGIVVSAWGYPIPGLALIAASAAWFITRSRKQWVVVVRDASGAEYDLPFDDPEAGIRFVRDFRAHWARQLATASRVAAQA